MNQFTGMGISPDGLDLPLGFGMHLAENPHAMQAYANLPHEQKAALIAEIQGGDTGEEAWERIVRVIERLNQS